MSKARDIADLGSNDVLETTSTGLDVTGTVTADGLDVDSGSDTRVLIGESGGQAALYTLNDASNNNTDLRINAENLDIYTDGTKGLSVASNGDVSFYEDTGTTAKMVWDASAESLGIGTSTPLKDLHLFSTGDTGIQITKAGSVAAQVKTVSGALLFGVDGANGATERARIDSSGNLLVGTTDTNIGTRATGSGYSLYSIGQMQISAEGNFANAILNTHRDGEIIQFRKDGSTVGSIGTYTQAGITTLGVNSTDGIFNIGGNNATGFQFIDSYGSGQPRLRPSTDNSADFGEVARRFKDLYLSGNSKANGYIFDGNKADPTSTIATIYDRAGTGLTASSLNFTVRTGTPTPSERMRVDSSGNLLIGTTSASAKVTIEPETNQDGLYIAQQGSGCTMAVLNAQNANTKLMDFKWYGTTIGSITNSGGVSIAYNTTSDERLKENIQDTTHTVDINDIQVREFDWKVDGSHQRYGFIAQELETVYPEAVHSPEDADEMKSVDYSKLVPLLVKEIQQLKAEIKELKA